MNLIIVNFKAGETITPIVHKTKSNDYCIVESKTRNTGARETLT